MAMHLKLPASMISNMAAGKKQIPIEHCPYIEDFTAGEVTCEELRPDKQEYFQLLRGRRVAAQGAVAEVQGAANA